MIAILIAILFIGINIYFTYEHYSNQKKKKQIEKSSDKITRLDWHNGYAEYDPDYNHYIVITKRCPNTFQTSKVYVIKSELKEIIEKLEKK